MSFRTSQREPLLTRRQSIITVLIGLASANALGCAPTLEALRHLHRIASTPRKPDGRISFAAINESSGLVKSRRWPDIFWTHNDSGDTARIFAIDKKGNIVHPANIALLNYNGISIEDATNVDWEDIATDDQGNLLIAACGNNANQRRDLGIYVVPEPDPRSVTTVRATKKIPFAFPDQSFAVDEPRNFDCEALFHAHGKMYVLTKHRSDLKTKRYRLDRSNGALDNQLTKLGEFDAGGMVTAADATADGRRVAVLTYDSIWMFEAGAGRDDYFSGSVHWLPISANQCEGICFDDQTLLITNEQRDIYRIPLTDLKLVRP